MLTISVDVLVRNVMDDFTGDVDERDVVGLSDVKMASQAQSVSLLIQMYKQ